MTEEIDVSQAQQQASRLATQADIRDVRLLKTSAELVRPPHPGFPLSYRLNTEVGIEYDEGDESFVVRAKYIVTIVEVSSDTVDNRFDDSNAAIAKIDFELGGLFSLQVLDRDEPPRIEELDAYAATTGQFALYPYAREYIYDLTGRLALPPLTVRVLRLPMVPDSARNQE